MQPEPPTPSHLIPRPFLLRRLKSFHYAFAGLFYMLRTQQNTWVHAVATLLVLTASILLHLSPTEWCWIIAAIAAVWITESLNTSLELLCDLVSPTYNDLIRHSKDIAAGAVLLTALAATLIGILIFLPHLLHL